MRLYLYCYLTLLEKLKVMFGFVPRVLESPHDTCSIKSSKLCIGAPLRKAKWLQRARIRYENTKCSPRTHSSLSYCVLGRPFFPFLSLTFKFTRENTFLRLEYSEVSASLDNDCPVDYRLTKGVAGFIHTELLALMGLS